MPKRTSNPGDGATEAWRRVVRGYEEALKVDGLPENLRETLERQLQAAREILGWDSGAFEPVGLGFERHSRESAGRRRPGEPTFRLGLMPDGRAEK
jgi:hypothetical protein